jgi:hypothetical protein
MQISKNYIRNDIFRKAFEALTEQYPQYAPELLKKRRLTFHDETGAVYTRDELPHFALTSELLYWLHKFNPNIGGKWWDTCDVIIAYWIQNLSAGKIWPDDANDIRNYISANMPVNMDFASGVIHALYTNQREIPYGKYLLNPASLLPKSKVATGTAPQGTTQGKGKGLALAGLGLLAVCAVRKIRSK